MAKFKKELNLDPYELKRAPLQYKKECLQEIEKYQKTAFWFTVLYSVGILLYIGVYSLIVMYLTLTNVKEYPNLSPWLLLIPFVTVVPSIIGSSMNKVAIIITIILYFAAGAAVTLIGGIINGWIILPSIVGIVIYYMLFMLLSSYNVLKNSEGFPYFIDAETMQMQGLTALSKKEETEKEETLSLLTQNAIYEAANNKNAPSNDDGANDINLKFNEILSQNTKQSKK